MRLTKEHVGKKIKFGTISAILVAVGGEDAWMKHSDGSHNTWHFEDPLYEIVEERKKPSERIGEFMGDCFSTPLLWNQRGLNATDTAIKAIVKYLDEQAEASK